MILHQDSILKLELDTQNDMVCVSWPDVNDVPVLVISHSFTKVTDAINDYNVSRLLIDSSSSFGEVQEEEYKALAMKLALDLSTTRIKKIARIVSQNERREHRAKANIAHLKSQLPFNFESRDFEDKASAVAWLKEA